VDTLREIAPYVALAGAVLAVVLFVVVLTLWSAVRRLRRAQTVVMGHHEARDIVGHVEDLDSQVRNLREAVEILTDQLDDQKRQLDHALTNRAIVRYDAFRDSGGEQSASFALLDQYRSGVVFSTIAARDFARIYVKHLSEGVADRDLSPEEVQAVALAVPKPIAAGEQGTLAKRVPLPEAAALPAAAATPRPAAAPNGVSEDAVAAFEALGDAVAGGDPDGRAGGAGAPTPQAAGDGPPAHGTPPSPADTADFTWETPAGRQTPDDTGSSGA